MELRDFEAMIARAKYRLKKTYGDEGEPERRLYTSDRGPIINVPVDGNQVDELLALAIEAYLDEEGLFEK